MSFRQSRPYRWIERAFGANVAEYVASTSLQHSIRHGYRALWRSCRTRKRYDASSSSLPSFVRALWFWAFPQKNICFFPNRPSSSQVVHKLSTLLNYGITNKPRKGFDVAFRQDDGAYSDAKLPEKAVAGRVVNAGCTDVSKDFVARAFCETFGYQIGVDPTQYRGPMVEKSNENYTHDGIVVDGPLPLEKVSEDKTYQKAIDNTQAGPERAPMVVDHRIVVYGSEIPLMYLKYRPVETRFSNENAFAELAEPSDHFSRKELETIVEFAAEMKADYSEIDVLRDNEDGRIYAVDVNNTPAGPPNGLTKSEQKIAIDRLKTAFEQFLHQFA